jgi:outer membrane murein-binding lipoprotein Lpp
VTPGRDTPPCDEVEDGAGHEGRFKIAFSRRTGAERGSGGKWGGEEEKKEKKEKKGRGSCEVEELEERVRELGSEVDALRIEKGAAEACMQQLRLQNKADVNWYESQLQALEHDSQQFGIASQKLRELEKKMREGELQFVSELQVGRQRLSCFTAVFYRSISLLLHVRLLLAKSCANSRSSSRERYYCNSKDRYSQFASELQARQTLEKEFGKVVQEFGKVLQQEELGKVK